MRTTRNPAPTWTARGRRRRDPGIRGTAGAPLIGFVGFFGLIGAVEARPAPQERSAHASVSRDEADRIMRMDYEEFAALRSSAERPAGYRWDTDGCTPDWAPRYFTRACHLHDFGYRNYGSARKEAPHLSPTADTKAWIDRRFFEEMTRICRQEAKTEDGRARCRQTADRLYAHVQKGRKAFFGPYANP
jgi:hypothetical protein